MYMSSTLLMNGSAHRTPPNSLIARLCCQGWIGLMQRPTGDSNACLQSWHQNSSRPSAMTSVSSQLPQPTLKLQPDSSAGFARWPLPPTTPHHRVGRQSVMWATSLHQPMRGHPRKCCPGWAWNKRCEHWLSRVGPVTGQPGAIP